MEITAKSAKMKTNAIFAKIIIIKILLRTAKNAMILVKAAMDQQLIIVMNVLMDITRQMDYAVHVMKIAKLALPLEIIV